MMMNLFRRRDEDGGTPPDGPRGSALPSHILSKFLKRLQAMSKPDLLDLGRVSGANIEFFARAGCRVRVEDLLNPEEDQSGPTGAEIREEAPAAAAQTEGTSAGRTDLALPPPPPSQEVADGSLPSRPADPRAGAFALRRSRGSALPPSEGEAARKHGAPPSLQRTPIRPSRRIVLPPRPFSSPIPGKNPSGPGQSTAKPGDPVRRATPDHAGRSSALATAFPLPDESFDAIVAWDIFNYYDQEAARLVAAEVRRILRPGGLVLAYFHARRLDQPESPGRYRILDERSVARDPLGGPLMRRTVYQNRDIEKMFTGLRIVELYFLKNGVREILMEKKAPDKTTPPKPQPAQRPPRPRFTIE
jgi:SAM-dependent methyltransferase